MLPHGRKRKRKTLVSCKFSSDTSKVKDSGLHAETPQESQMPSVFSEWVDRWSRIAEWTQSNQISATKSLISQSLRGHEVNTLCWSFCLRCLQLAHLPDGRLRIAFSFSDKEGNGVSLFSSLLEFPSAPMIATFHVGIWVNNDPCSAAFIPECSRVIECRQSFFPFDLHALSAIPPTVIV